MAAGAITPLVLSTRDSSAGSQLTLTVVTTAAASGAYVDLTGYKGTNMIIVATMTATNVKATYGGTLRIQACTVSQYSGYKKDDLQIRLSSAVVAQKGIFFTGPLDLSRFKDSNERITIKCTRGTNIAALGAILIE
jgi:hypothetical protein